MESVEHRRRSDLYVSRFPVTVVSLLFRRLLLTHRRIRCQRKKGILKIHRLPEAKLSTESVEAAEHRIQCDRLRETEKALEILYVLCSVGDDLLRI